MAFVVCNEQTRTPEPGKIFPVLCAYLTTDVVFPWTTYRERAATFATRKDAERHLKRVGLTLGITQGDGGLQNEITIEVVQ